MLCVVSSLDGAKRNPGTAFQASTSSPGFAALHPGYEQHIKRRQNAGRRIWSFLRAIRARLARNVARSPDGVPPRRLRQRTNAAAQLQARFLGRGCRRALSAVPYPSPASYSQTGHHAGRAFFPKPPGSGGDEPLPAGTALAPIGRRHPADVLSEQDVRNVTERGTIVKMVVPTIETCLAREWRRGLRRERSR
jgi:hypothetical protein